MPDIMGNGLKEDKAGVESNWLAVSKEIEREREIKHMIKHNKMQMLMIKIWSLLCLEES